MNSPNAAHDRLHRGVAGQTGLLLIVVLGCWALVYLPWLGLLDLLLEEPRRALIARTMMETGDYLVPRLGGEIYTAKPPLFNWLIAFSATVGGGLNEWTARIPSVVAVALLTAVFLWTTRSLLSTRGLLFLGLSLVLAPELIAKGVIAEIETVFTLLVSLSIWSWYVLDQRGRRGWQLWGLPLVLVALAYLAKREPAVVFFYLSVIPYLLLRRRWRELLAPGHIASGLVALVLVGGWLALVALQTGWEALWDTLQREVLQRGTQQDWGEVIRHILLYPLELLAAMLPFSLLLPFLAVGRMREALRNRHGDLLLFCGVALLANLPVYWFRGDVSVRYFMPMFPFALLLAAMVFEVLVEEPQLAGKWGTRYLRVAGWGCLGIAVLLLVLAAVTIVLPLFVAEREALVPPLLAIGCVVAVGASLGWIYRSRQRHPAATLLGSFIVVVLTARLVYFNFLLPDKVQRVEAERNAPTIVEQLQRITSDATVAVHGVPWAIWYYAPSGMFEPWVPDRNGNTRPWWLLESGFFAERVRPTDITKEVARFQYKGTELVLVRALQAESVEPQ